MAPPAADGFDRKLGGVVIDPHTDPAVIVRRIVHSIGTNLAQLLIREIVSLDECWLRLRLIVPPPIGKLAHEFLLFRIGGSDRLSRTRKNFHTAIGIATLRMSVGV